MKNRVPRSCIRQIACWAALLIATAMTSAEDQRPPEPPGKVTEQTSVKKECYLGVVTEPIPEALAVQLKGVLPSGRGLVVKRVLPDSPAAKAGVQPFDVLSAADAQPLASSDQLKDLVTSQPAGQMLKLHLIRGAKVHVVDVTPGERTVSRIVHRHFDADGKPGEDAGESVAGRKKAKAAADKLVEPPAYSVGVQTRDGRTFQVEVRLAAGTETPQKFSGSAEEIAVRMKALPESIQRSVQRQLGRLAEDRNTLRTVQFRFQPQRDGNRQVLTVTLRKPAADGTVKSFELQHPLGDATQPVALENMLDVPDFAAQLRELDPAVREKIASTLKTASLPAATLKVEDSQ